MKNKRGDKMTAFLIVRVNVLDENQFNKYLAISPEVVKKYSGKYLARGGKTITLEGTKEERRVVVIEFPSSDKAREFYYSPEYQEAIELRKEAAIGEMVIVEGLS